MPNHTFTPHDHAKCIASSLASAENLCEQKNLNLTSGRRRVLEILLSDHKARGAYEILDILREEGFGGQPPVVYRALDFLMSVGLVHRVEQLNAYVACTIPQTPHQPALLICKDCAQIEESNADPVSLALNSDAIRDGFTVETTVIEALGVCPECSAKSS